ncbi:PREDICTED: fibrous sheath CABYR-binding protein [Propithecus coquereli]|uniref:fibrous sheath CABYR-binding protein n=1 Tax=Propithecus coquereli TaxID=379532 RepID=UPI00063F016B|nr:PREDICTED: fibrous sheath CABYR-binding protein [Propithecus coquereli]
MEESDEPDQPISAGRQEIRKRRRPSQPMVNKSQQTEVTEKKKHTAIPQSSGPKATLSIGNIPGSKGNYSAKDYESLRVSSQLQQTWTKRKHGQEMTDKSLQTDTSVEEKKEVKLVDETMIPEEKPAGVGEAAAELPESIQEVEIPPHRHSIQLKIDRSQQTSCTGDWTMMNMPPEEKVDKEQQTYFSESEIVVISRPGSSFTNSKEGAQKRKSSGKIFVSEHPEFQPATCSNEEIMQKSISRPSLTQETKKGSPVVLEDELRQEVVEEGSVDKKKSSAEIEPPPTAKVPTEAQHSPTEEATAEVEPSPAEETLVQVQTQTEETQTEETPAEVQPLPAEEPFSEEPPGELKPQPAEEIPSTEPPAEVQPPPAEESFSEEPPDELKPQPGEEIPSTEPPAEIQSPLAEEVPVEVQLPPVEKALGKASDKVEHITAEEIPAKIQPPSAEETMAEEASDDIQFLAATEAPSEEVPAEVQMPLSKKLSVESLAEEPPDEVQSPLLEEAPAEEVPAEVQPPPIEEAPIEEVPLEIQFLPAEEAPTEETTPKVQSPPDDEAPTEEIPPEVWFPPAEEAPTEETTPEVQFPPDDKAPIEETPAEVQFRPDDKAPIKETPAEVPLPPAEEASTEKTTPEVQIPPAEETPVEEAPIYERPPLADLLPVEDFPIQEISAEISPLVENVSTELQSPQVEGIPVKLGSVDLIDDTKFQEVLKTDSVPEDLSNTKNGQTPTLEIEGVINIELRKTSS